VAELSTKSVRRGPGRPFQKGVSGCPDGRPRQDVTALARAHTVDAIEALVAALKRPKEAVPAAVALLNRGWGLPRVSVEGVDSADFTILHLLAAKSVAAELQRAVAVGLPPTVNLDAVAKAGPADLARLATLPPALE
jgi:hypothetical protein